MKKIALILGLILLTGCVSEPEISDEVVDTEPTISHDQFLYGPYVDVNNIGHHKTNKMKIDDKFVKVGVSFIQQETFPDNTEGGNEQSRCYLSDVFLRDIYGIESQVSGEVCSFNIGNMHYTVSDGYIIGENEIFGRKLYTACDSFTADNYFYMDEIPFRSILDLRRLMGYQKEGAEDTRCILNFGSYIGYTKPAPTYFYDDGTSLNTMQYEDGEILDSLDAQPFDVTLKGEYVYRVYDPQLTIYLEREGRFYPLTCTASEPMMYPE